MTNLDRTFMTAQELIYTKEILTQEEYEICLIYWPAAAKAHLIHRPGTFSACRSAGIRRTNFNFNNKYMNEEQNIIEPQQPAFLQGVVMRSASEVLSRLEEAEKELAYNQEWYKKARENYDGDRKFWGQADDGEMRVASDAASESQREVTILKWVLGHP